MKVLGVVCSPRLNGNTEILMREVLNSAQESGAETELITLAGKDIRFCDACESCAKTGKCKINDDMQEIYGKIRESDGIVLGSPVYFRTVSGQAKVLIDRLACFIPTKALRDKVGASVVVAQRAGNTSAFSVLANVFNGERMLDAGGVMAYGLREGDVRKDKRGMGEAKALGRVIVRHILRNQTIDKSRNIEDHIHIPPRLVGSYDDTEVNVW